MHKRMVLFVHLCIATMPLFQVGILTYVGGPRWSRCRSNVSMNKRFDFTFLRFRSVGPHYRGAGRRGAIMNAVRLRIRFVSGRKLVHLSRDPSSLVAPIQTMALTAGTRFTARHAFKLPPWYFWRVIWRHSQSLGSGNVCFQMRDPV
jgi:hypothetical protein